MTFWDKKMLIVHEKLLANLQKGSEHRTLLNASFKDEYLRMKN